MIHPSFIVKHVQNETEKSCYYSCNRIILQDVFLTSLSLMYSCWRKIKSVKWLWTYNNNRLQSTNVGKVNINVLQSISSSPEWAATLLPTWVLSTQFFCEVLVIANFVFTEKIKLPSITLDKYTPKYIRRQQTVLS